MLASRVALFSGKKFPSQAIAAAASQRSSPFTLRVLCVLCVEKLVLFVVMINTIEWKNGKVYMVDQTLLPGEEV